MTGYCLELKKTVEMTEIVTILLPDKSFVQRGKYREKGRTYTIVRKVDENELIVEVSGHFVPKTVYAGPQTPGRLIHRASGQTVIQSGEKKELKAPGGQIVTLAELKQRERIHAKK